MIKTVMFDMGGTLEDIYTDEKSIQNAVREVILILKYHGIDLQNTPEDVRKKLLAGWDRYAVYRDYSMRELKPEEIWGNYVLTDFGIGFKEAEGFAEELAHSWEVTYYHRSLRPRVSEMLSGLKSLGLKLGIISNTASLFQVFDILEEYGIRGYFSDVTLSSVTGYRKPHPYIFKISLDQLEADPIECAYVGDTYSRDIIGSHNAGFGKTFHINSHLTKIKDAQTHTDYKADYSLMDIYDVFPILRDLNK